MRTTIEDEELCGCGRRSEDTEKGERLTEPRRKDGEQEDKGFDDREQQEEEEDDDRD